VQLERELFGIGVGTQFAVLSRRRGEPHQEVEPVGERPR
jgi:hypothetical protein